MNLYETVHPSIQSAITVVQAHFDSYAVGEQDFLESDEQVQKVLQLIPDDGEFKVCVKFYWNIFCWKIYVWWRWTRKKSKEVCVKFYRNIFCWKIYVWWRWTRKKSKVSKYTKRILNRFVFVYWE